jgi:MFS family permease
LREPHILTSLRSGIVSKFSSDALLASVDFRRFWFSSVLNAFGAQITALAVPLSAVLLLHASAAQMGMLAASQAIPFALFALPVGVWLDRNVKFPIIIYCELMYGIALGSIPLAYWLGILSMPWLYAVSFILGSGAVAGGGAEQIFLTFLVGRDRVIDAQAKFAATDSASRLVAPGIAGVLIQLLSAPLALVVTATGFFVSIWNLSHIRVKEPKPEPSGKHPLREMREGLVFVWNHPLLRWLAWAAGAWHILFYGSAALGVLYATRVLGLSPGVLGIMQVLGGTGVLISSVMLKPLTRRYGSGGTILIGLSATAVGFMLMPLIPSALFGSSMATAIAYGALTCCFDCGVMTFLMPYVALRQRLTPDAMLGRMVSTMRFLTVATAPLGALSAGFVADHFSVRTGLACVAAGALALMLQMIFFSPLRTVHD